MDMSKIQNSSHFGAHPLSFQGINSVTRDYKEAVQKGRDLGPLSIGVERRNTNDSWLSFVPLPETIAELHLTKDGPQIVLKELSGVKELLEKIKELQQIIDVLEKKHES